MNRRSPHRGEGGYEIFDGISALQTKLMDRIVARYAEHQNRDIIELKAGEDIPPEPVPGMVCATCSSPVFRRGNNGAYFHVVSPSWVGTIARSVRPVATKEEGERIDQVKPRREPTRSATRTRRSRPLQARRA